jgi:hypothetical protein
MNVEVKGTRLWFDVDCSALVPDGPEMRERPTIVLLHGGPGSFDHSYFKPDFARLATAAQVVYLDLSGHGRSDWGDPGQTAAEQEMMRSRGAERIRTAVRGFAGLCLTTRPPRPARRNRSDVAVRNCAGACGVSRRPPAKPQWSRATKPSKWAQIRLAPCNQEGIALRMDGIGRRVPCPGVT